MKNKIRYSLSFVLAVATLVMLFSIPVCAAKSDYITFGISNDFETLTKNKSETFKKIDLPWGYSYSCLKTKYFYKNKVSSNNSRSYSMQSSGKDSSVLMLTGYNNFKSVYVSTDVLNEFSDFIKGGAAENMIISSETGRYCELDPKDYEKFKALDSDEISVNAADLNNCKYFTISSFDPSLSVCRDDATLFFYNEQLLFVDHSKLDNNNFDSDCNLSFRSGTIKGVYVNDQSLLNKFSQKSLVNKCTQTKGYEKLYEEDEEVSDFFSGISGIAMAIVGFVLIGFVIPLAIGLTGLIIAIKAKHRGSKRWLALPILSAAWILLSVIILVIFLIFA